VKGRQVLPRSRSLHALDQLLLGCWWYWSFGRVGHCRSS
jgi:hypothetical protein